MNERYDDAAQRRHLGAWIQAALGTGSDWDDICESHGPQERQALAAALLGQIPASCRAAEGLRDHDCAAQIAWLLAAIPGDMIKVITRWLRAARAEAGQP